LGERVRERLAEGIRRVLQRPQADIAMEVDLVRLQPPDAKRHHE
jgi:hypothetical protein